MRVQVGGEGQVMAGTGVWRVIRKPAEELNVVAFTGFCLVCKASTPPPSMTRRHKMRQTRLMQDMSRKRTHKPKYDSDELIIIDNNVFYLRDFLTSGRYY